MKLNPANEQQIRRLHAETEKSINQIGNELITAALFRHGAILSIAEFGHIVAMFSQPAIVTNGDRKVIGANTLFLELLGYTEDEVIGTSGLSLLTGRGQQIARRNLEHPADTPIYITNPGGLGEWRHKDGSPIPARNIALCWQPSPGNCFYLGVIVELMDGFGDF